MELSQIIPHIEALIFASDKPLSLSELTELVNNALGFIENRASMEQIEAGVDGIREKYNAEFYAFELREIGGGFQFLTKKEYHKTVAQLNGEKFLKRLSTAALETLAIIAYKQPVTKSEIESIRGVNCDYAVQKLLEKDLVSIAGRNEDAVGKPLIYATSRSFMDYFGINSAEELPKISEVLMEELVQATNMNDSNNEDLQETPTHVSELPEEALAVSSEGELIDVTEVAQIEETTEIEADAAPATENEEEKIADDNGDAIDEEETIAEDTDTIDEEETPEENIEEEITPDNSDSNDEEKTSAEGTDEANEAHLTKEEKKTQADDEEQA